MRSGDGGGGGGGGNKEVINIYCGLRAIIAGNVHYLCTCSCISKMDRVTIKTEQMNSNRTPVCVNTEIEF